MLLNDSQIYALCHSEHHLDAPMITPFQISQIRRTVSGIPAISSGISSYGYDIRLSDSGLKLFPETGGLIDPKNFDESLLISLTAHSDETGTFYILPPHAYVLGVSVETFHIPNNVLGICYCKSTYARCGLKINTTPLEPGWRGRLVLEFSNGTALPMKVYANEGIAQVVFDDGATPEVTYADRSGKYQDQEGIVLPRL